MTKLIAFLFLSCLVFFQSCVRHKSVDPKVEISASDFKTSVMEYPKAEKSLGKIDAKINSSDALKYSLESQEVDNALQIDANTGELKVKNTAVFVNHINPVIKAKCKVSNGVNEKLVNITVDVKDIGPAFKIKVAISGADKTINIIKGLSTAYDYTVDWGDSDKSTSINGNTSHEYTADGDYIISITGTFPSIRFVDDISALSSKINTNIISVEQWGNNHWQSTEHMFSQCKSLQKINAPDLPILRDVENMSFMFAKASEFNSDLSKWDVSQVTNMQAMFSEASEFNSDLSKWDVSQVTNMQAMFDRTEKFNSPINDWDVSKVTNMQTMFQSAKVFDQPLDKWSTKVTKVTNIRWMFAKTQSFLQDLKAWQLQSVTSTSSNEFVVDSKMTCDKIPVKIKNFGGSGCK